MRSKRRRVLRRSVRKNTRKNTRRRNTRRKNTRRRNTRRSVRRSTRRSIKRSIKRSRKNIIQSGGGDLKKRKKKRKIYPAYIFNDLETKYPDIMILKLYLARDSNKPKFISLFEDLVTEGVIGDVAVEKAEEYYAADPCTAGFGESCSCKKCFLKKEVLEIIDSIHTEKKKEEDKLKEEYEAQVAELKAELEWRGQGGLIDVVLKVMERVRIPAGEWLTEIMGMESDGTLKQFLELCKARALAEAS